MKREGEEVECWEKCHETTVVFNRCGLTGPVCVLWKFEIQVKCMNEKKKKVKNTRHGVYFFKKSV